MLDRHEGEHETRDPYHAWPLGTLPNSRYLRRGRVSTMCENLKR